MKVGPLFVCLLLMLLPAARSGAVPTFRVEPRGDRYRLASPTETRANVLGERNGLVLLELTAQQRDEALQFTPREGGGADVAELSALQLLFLDSACTLSGGCGGPCNDTVVLLWRENTANPSGVDIFLDGTRLGNVPGLPANQVPGVNGANIFRVPAGMRTFRASAVDQGSMGEVTLNVIDSQPFDDPSNLECRQGAVAGNGTCELVVTWVNAAPPDRYGVVVDDVFRGFVPGNSTEITIPGLQPGMHCLMLVGRSSVAGSDYRGCLVESCCNLSCVSTEDCNPPSSLLACQFAYGTAVGGNAVVLGWINGESPYGVGLNFFLDGVSIGSLLTDPMSGNPSEAIIDDLSAGDHSFGVQGNCGPPDGVSTIPETTLEVLTQTPHTTPVLGDLNCVWSAEEGGTTTVTWTNADPSDFIRFYVEVGNSLVLVGLAPGAITALEVHGTVATDVIVLQFFVVNGGQCYGSELMRCEVPTGRNRFIRGLCDGVNAQPTISSAVFLFNFLFLGGDDPPCVAACDSNGNGGRPDISDGSYVLNFLFLGGPAPPGWTNHDADPRLDPTCEEAAEGADCAASHGACTM